MAKKETPFFERVMKEVETLPKATLDDLDDHCFVATIKGKSVLIAEDGFGHTSTVARYVAAEATAFLTNPGTWDHQFQVLKAMLGYKDARP